MDSEPRTLNPALARQDFARGCEENRAQLDAFLANRFVGFLPVTLTTAERFSLIASALKRKGTPIPSNDIWIAAHALESGADLLSFDEHFSGIEGLAFVHLRETGNPTR